MWPGVQKEEARGGRSAADVATGSLPSSTTPAPPRGRARKKKKKVEVETGQLRWPLAAYRPHHS